MSERGLVSIVVPARNERFLVPTVQDILANATGNLECIVVLDGWWPNPPLPEDKRLRILHRGQAHGMRPAINDAARIARGEFLAKCDGHVLWAQGWDDQLKADYLEGNWILTPRRHALDAENWKIDESRPDKYPVDYEYLSWPWANPDHPLTGFHGQPWNARKAARAHLELDLDLSSQGSAWFMAKSHWEKRLDPLRMDLFGSFFGESQEIGLATQLSGGAMMRTKRTFYAHLRKSAKYGRGYVLGPNGHRRGAELMLRRCVMNDWPGRTRSFEDLIKQFKEPIPGWPADWERFLAEKRADYEREAAA